MEQLQLYQQLKVYEQQAPSLEALSEGQIQEAARGSRPCRC